MGLQQILVILRIHFFKKNRLYIHYTRVCYILAGFVPCNAENHGSPINHLQTGLSHQSAKPPFTAEHLAQTHASQILGVNGKIYKMMTTLPSFLELHLVYLDISAAFPNHAKAMLRPTERKVEMCVW